MENSPLICLPGQRLCLTSKHSSGHGTYERQGYVYSSLAGVVHIVNEDKTSVIEVRSINDQSTVPSPGDIVTAKVMIVNQRFAKCLITCIGDTVLTRPYRGILRKEDVRSFEKDRVEMYKCYRPGDIILARVLPISEVHSYQLSTAENELGVVIAHSEAGVAMIPISWTCMQCPKSYNKEERKVAKVVPEKITLD
ncbi:exosome complex component CSL4 [Macrosteles quadrilineatus]|uniref:exosome complex component CSL4 n=1 Tax=Macrosteles quadrilineatus TaxID=74068 RepID=UPI0023E18A32|nr:exosome complex component CSL4 [Macrosteles quadrilineatus]